MASLTSPDWRGFMRRAPLPAGSVPTTPADSTQARALWYSRQQTAPLPAIPHPAPAAPLASRPAGWPLAPSAAFPSWWIAAWSPQTTPPPHPRRPASGAASGHAGSTSHPPRPNAGRDADGTGGPRPISPRLRLALEWVVASLPAEQRKEVFTAFVKTLRFRAGNDQPCSLEGTQPIGRARQSARGETLVPEGTVRVREWLDEEVRETLRTCEMRLSRTRRNHYLAMHSARLGQLWRELERRFEIDVLEEVKHALGRCWA